MNKDRLITALGQLDEEELRSARDDDPSVLAGLLADLSAEDLRQFIVVTYEWSRRADQPEEESSAWFDVSTRAAQVEADRRVQEDNLDRQLNMNDPTDDGLGGIVH